MFKHKSSLSIIFCCFLHPLNLTYLGTVNSVTIQEFLCTVRSDCNTQCSEVENCLSASVEAAKRDLETGIITLTLNVVYTPFRPCR